MGCALIYLPFIIQTVWLIQICCCLAALVLSLNLVPSLDLSEMVVVVRSQHAAADFGHQPTVTASLALLESMDAMSHTRVAVVLLIGSRVGAQGRFVRRGCQQLAGHTILGRSLGIAAAALRQGITALWGRVNSGRRCLHLPPLLLPCTNCSGCM